MTREHAIRVRLMLIYQKKTLLCFIYSLFILAKMRNGTVHKVPNKPENLDVQQCITHIYYKYNTVKYQKLVKHLKTPTDNCHSYTVSFLFIFKLMQTKSTSEHFNILSGISLIGL